MSALFPHDPDVEMTHHQGAENTELRSVHVDKWVGAPVCYTIRRAAVVAYCRCHKKPAGTTQHIDKRNIHSGKLWWHPLAGLCENCTNSQKNFQSLLCRLSVELDRTKPKIFKSCCHFELLIK